METSFGNHSSRLANRSDGVSTESGAVRVRKAGWLATALLTLAGCSDSLAEANRLVESGLVAARQEQYEKAYELFAQAERIHPGFTPAMVASGELAIDLGEYDRADADLSRAIALDPHIMEWREKRATVRQLAGRYDESLSDYDAVIAVQPENSAALYNRGALLALRGNKAAAAADLERAFRVEQ